jgi:hypothetical protein
MKSATLKYTDLVDFGVKASADEGVAFLDVQRAFVRAVRAVYSEGAAKMAAATSGFLDPMSREGGSLPTSKARKLHGGAGPETLPIPKRLLMKFMELDRDVVRRIPGIVDVPGLDCTSCLSASNRPYP